jgi:HEAT repeat protein
VATVEDERDILELVLDRDLGDARIAFPEALAKIRGLSAVPLLIEFLQDPLLVGETLVVLGKLRARAARENIVPFLEHSDSWVRKKAKEALRRIDKRYPDPG